jgi:hypothetical protein
MGWGNLLRHFRAVTASRRRSEMDMSIIAVNTWVLMDLRVYIVRGHTCCVVETGCMT